MLRMRSGVSKRAPIIERKTRLDGSVVEFACAILALEPGRRAVLRYDIDREWRVADGRIVVPKGAVTAAHYWIDRPYNVYHWLDGARTLGHYFNAGLTDEITAERVSWRDLVVDVLVAPDGTFEILDEDELPADIAAEHRKAIARALEAIVTNPRRLVAEIERESRALL